MEPRKDVRTVMDNIKSAFASEPRPIPIGQDIDNHWLALEELYAPERGAMVSTEFDAIVQLWPAELAGYEANVIRWVLPRLLCGVLRDGLLNAPECIDFLNTTDTPFMIAPKHWPMFRNLHIQALSTLNKVQISAVIDWLLEVRAMLVGSNFEDPQINRIVELEIEAWRNRLSARGCQTTGIKARSASASTGSVGAGALPDDTLEAESGAEGRSSGYSSHPPGSTLVSGSLPDSRQRLIKTIQSAFSTARRPTPEGGVTESDLLALEALYLPEAGAEVSSESASKIAEWPIAFAGFGVRTIKWVLPRLLCGVLRDGVANVPNLIEYLNLTDTPVMVDPDHWPVIRREQEETLDRLDASQTSSIADWLLGGT